MNIIKGNYRDILKKEGKVPADFGWKCNTIVTDYGRFLAALMKKDFHAPVGIEYLAVGSDNQGGAEFRDKVVEFFQRLNENPTHKGPLFQGNNWVWAKPIGPVNIQYLDSVGYETQDITNTLKLELKFAKNEPLEETLEFREFALLDIDKTKDNLFDTSRLFLINYASHGTITKDKDTELSRTIKLTFPMIEEKEES